MGMLERITADMLAHEPDHVALTGDLVNIGLESEFVTAQRYVERIGGPAFVSVIPGNHDAYVRSSFRYMAATASPWMADDGAETASFPYVRRRGGVALIGLTSGVPTAPLLASGELGPRQLAAFRERLRALKAEGLIRVVMIHHPPFMKGASLGRGLRDAHGFEEAILDEGAELVIHGHNHRHSVKRIAGPDGPVPVVGVAVGVRRARQPEAHGRVASLRDHPAGRRAGDRHEGQGAPPLRRDRGRGVAGAVEGRTRPHAFGGWTLRQCRAMSRRVATQALSCSCT